MQLTPEEKNLFEALAHNRVFQGWLTKQEEQTLKVLKVNPNPPVLYQAQGAAQFIDTIRAVCSAAANK